VKELCVSKLSVKELCEISCVFGSCVCEGVVRE
jgi:hypothetical protein